jgi:glycosyltransferase involved in cell wall biosynthesis
MLRQLATRHQVTLVSFVRPDDTPQSIEHLRSICHAVHPVSMRRSMRRNVRAGVKGLITGLPMVIARDEIGEMMAILRRLTAETTFDVIHADQLSMAGYGQLAAGMAQPHQPRTLLDEHNAIHLLACRVAGTEPNALRRAVTLRESHAFARYEAHMCQAYDAVLTITREDRDHLLALFAPSEQQGLADKFTVVPICVDPQQIEPVVHRDGDMPTVLHLGTMFWPPNVAGVLWFARKVLPLIHLQMPEVRFVVVGKNPPPEVQALAGDPRIHVAGYVADPQPYLQAADACIVPLHAAGGMRVKVLDGWLWGLPIISTTLGVEGIEYRDGQDLLVANNAPSFAQATMRLLTDPDLNRQMRENGRAWVETHYAWQVVYRQVDGIYTRLLNRDRDPD